MRSRSVAPALLLAVVAGVLAPATAAFAAVPAKYANCTEYRKSYPHGVGTTTARDRTSSTPVTTFRKDNAEFGRAMHFNAGLDRDKDKIACEKR